MESIAKCPFTRLRFTFIIWKLIFMSTSNAFFVTCDMILCKHRVAVVLNNKTLKRKKNIL